MVITAKFATCQHGFYIAKTYSLLYIIGAAIVRYNRGCNGPEKIMRNMTSKIYDKIEIIRPKNTKKPIY